MRKRQIPILLLVAQIKKINKLIKNMERHNIESVQIEHALFCIYYVYILYCILTL